MPTLYEIPMDLAEAFARYENLLSESAGEFTPEVEEAEKNLEQLLTSSADKIEATACVIRNLEADVTAVKAEAARLMQRGQSMEANAGRLKLLIGRALPAFGGKIKTARFTIYTQKNPPSYELTVAPDINLTAVAAQFPELIKLEPEVRRSVVTGLYKQGVPLPEGFTVSEKPETYSTRIK